MIIYNLPTLEEVTKKVTSYIEKNGVNHDNFLIICHDIDMLSSCYATVEYREKRNETGDEDVAKEYRQMIIDRLASLYHTLLK